jgi:hypothetical protein
MSLGTTFPKTFTTFAPSGHLECELKKRAGRFFQISLSKIAGTLEKRHHGGKFFEK